MARRPGVSLVSVKSVGLLRPLGELVLLLLQFVAASSPVHAGEDSTLRVAVVAGTATGRAGHHVELGRGGATLAVEANSTAAVTIVRVLAVDIRAVSANTRKT